MSKLDRRDLIGAGGAMLLGQAATASAAFAIGSSPSPSDNDYWRGVAAQYDITREVVQFENGMWGMMPRPVSEAYRRHTQMVNSRNSFYARRQYDADLEKIRSHAARDLGVPAEEIAFTRGATESLIPALQTGHRRTQNRLCSLIGEPPQRLFCKYPA